MVACSPFGPAGEFAASRHGALTRSQAAAQGLTTTTIRRMLRDRILTEPVPGVLVVVGSPPTWRQRLYVATLAGSGAGAVGYGSAAALHGMDGYADGDLQLIVATCRHLLLPGFEIHRAPLEAIDVVEIDGIRTTGIARTLSDLGRFDTRLQVKIAFEWAWRNGHSLEWMRWTAKRFVSPRRRGPRMLLSLVEEAEHHMRPTESTLEVRVEEVIMSLPGIVRQFTVRRADGSTLARTDFAIPELKIAIEGHSRKHHFGPDATESDARREDDLQAQGWIVRFVTDRQRKRPDELRRSLLRLVDARRRQLGEPPSASGSTS